MADLPNPPTAADLEARRKANADATAEALRLAAEHKAADEAAGKLPGDAGLLMSVVPSLKDKLIGEDFSDTATLRPREGSAETA